MSVERVGLVAQLVAMPQVDDGGDATVQHFRNACLIESVQRIGAQHAAPLGLAIGYRIAAQVADIVGAGDRQVTGGAGCISEFRIS